MVAVTFVLECKLFVFHYVGYMKRFRYCNYFGKYFCNTCHSPKPTTIPARIIQRWDFKEYPFNYFIFSAADNPGNTLHYSWIIKSVKKCRTLHSFCHLNDTIRIASPNGMADWLLTVVLPSSMFFLTVCMYQVSNFARDLLSKVYHEPLFNIPAINKTLYKKVNQLDDVKVWRN